MRGRGTAAARVASRTLGACAVATVAVSLALFGLGLGGCVATEVAAPPRGVVVSGPPPAPMAEIDRPAAPSQASVWIVGYWHWTGTQYTWIPGHWENAPPGAAWNAPRYVAHGGAYFYEAGTWRPSEGAGPRTSANALR
jgi:hypothetical protein